MQAGDELYFIEETNGIGLKNESSLHSSIKKWYCSEGDRLEVKVDGFIIDLVRDSMLVEIQTKNFFVIKGKLKKLVKKHKVNLVYPISVEKTITKISMNGENISKRKSPKKGTLTQVFNELIRIPELINEENFTLEVLMIKEEEIRCEDGKGSWRRKGVSILDRKLLEVVQSIKFLAKEDFLLFLPAEFRSGDIFSNKVISEYTKEPIANIRKMTYCLKKMSLIEASGKKGNQLLYRVLIEK
jgi:hypothetical protein